METVKIGDLVFEVSADGDVSQPQRVPAVMLDEVRLAAASAFLSNPKALSKSQYGYWSAVRTVTPEVKRFASGRARV